MSLIKDLSTFLVTLCFTMIFIGFVDVLVRLTFGTGLDLVSVILTMAVMSIVIPIHYKMIGKL